MPTNLTDVDTFSATVAVPSDGESANSASLAAMAQTLANRTRNSKNRLDILEGDTSAHDIVVPMSAGIDATSTAGGVPAWKLAPISPGNAWDTDVNQRVLSFGLNDILRDGMSLTGYKVRWDPGDATQTGSNVMRAELWYDDYDPTTLVRTATQLGAALTATPSSGAAEVRSDTFAAHVVDKTLREYTLVVTSSAGASTTDDQVEAAALTVANPTSP